MGRLMLGWWRLQYHRPELALLVRVGVLTVGGLLIVAGLVVCFGLR